MEGDWRCHWCGFRPMKSACPPPTQTCRVCRGDFPWEHDGRCAFCHERLSEHTDSERRSCELDIEAALSASRTEQP